MINTPPTRQNVMFVYGTPYSPLTRRDRYHLGVAQLSAILKQRGITPKLFFIFDWTTQEQKRFAAVLEEERIDFVCFSVICTPVLEDIRPFMQIARDRGRIVILGGPQLRFAKEPPDTPAHYVCQGDGDLLPDFIQKGDTTLFQQRLTTENIQDLPLPDYDLMIPYLRPTYPGDDPETFMLPYLTSRDCPWNCSFCMDSLAPTKKLRIRAKVKEDIDCLSVKYPGRITSVHFGDGTMPYYSEKWRESWEGISFPFGGQIRADIDPKLLRWLRDRGLTFAFLGIEEADEADRNGLFNKQLTDKEIYRTVRTLHDWGIDLELSFIYGAPGQAGNAKEKALAMVEKIIKTDLVKRTSNEYWAPFTKVYLNEYTDYTSPAQKEV